MKQVNIHEAKTHLSRLVEAAAKGESFIIAKAGKPVVKVTAIDAPPKLSREEWLGGMKGKWRIPDDIDRFGEDEILDMFGLK
jgi:prevent-host-death family protein